MLPSCSQSSPHSPRPIRLKVTDHGTFKSRDLGFLSGSPREHHQLVLASGRNDGPGVNVLNQISLKAGSLDSLRALSGRLAEAGIAAGDRKSTRLNSSP